MGCAVGSGGVGDIAVILLSITKLLEQASVIAANNNIRRNSQFKRFIATCLSAASKNAVVEIFPATAL